MCLSYNIFLLNKQAIFLNLPIDFVINIFSNIKLLDKKFKKCTYKYGVSLYQITFFTKRKRKYDRRKEKGLNASTRFYDSKNNYS